MRAPYCEICDVEVVPGDDAFVTFAPETPIEPSIGQLGLEHDTRRWFCPEHIDRARARSHRPPWVALVELSLDADVEAGRSPHDGEAYVSVPIGEWPLSEARAALEACAPEILALLDMPPAPRPLHWSGRRSWSPMDGVEPPWCPYGDEAWGEVVTERYRLRISTSANHWDDERVANSAADLTVRWRGSGTRERLHLSISSASQVTPTPIVDHLVVGTIDTVHLRAARLVLDLLR
ncbi:MAG: hypothetical protein AAGA99_24250 [Actinomycetota bacterium]